MIFITKISLTLYIHEARTRRTHRDELSDCRRVYCLIAACR